MNDQITQHHQTLEHLKQTSKERMINNHFVQMGKMVHIASRAQRKKRMMKFDQTVKQKHIVNRSASEFRNFSPIIKKACKSSEQWVSDHFVEMHEMVGISSASFDHLLQVVKMVQPDFYSVVQFNSPQKELNYGS